MKSTVFLLLWLLMGANYESFASDSTKNRLIASIMTYNKPISLISWQKDPFFSTQDSIFDTHPQNLIKTASGLYVFINGSGRLYKVVDKPNNFEFSRVDSTVNFGYNIGAFGFQYNNRIYNLGGYGYWRMNGQLRVFNEKAKQWDIVKLNREIPILTGISEGLIWYDVPAKKIYTAYYINRNEAVKGDDLDETQYVYNVMVLDLQKNEWSELGKLNSFLNGKLQIIKPITISSWGQLISIGDKISLLDFKNNQILSLKTTKEYYQSLARAFWGSSFYFKDSTLYYGNKSKIDSIQVHYADFITNNQPLYASENRILSENNKYGIILLISILVVTIVLLYRYKTKKNKKISEKFELTLDSPNQKVFDEMEIQLLQLIINNTAKGNTTNTEEQNKVLGLGKKNAEIQKKQRSDIILSINKKYSFVTKNSEPLIQKKRAEFDKRAFEYFIDYVRLDEISNFLKTNTVNG